MRTIDLQPNGLHPIELRVVSPFETEAWPPEAASTHNFLYQRDLLSIFQSNWDTTAC